MQNDFKKLGLPVSLSADLCRVELLANILNSFKATRSVVTIAMAPGKNAAPIGSKDGSGRPLELMNINTLIVREIARKLISYLNLSMLVIGLSRKLGGNGYKPAPLIVQLA